MSCSPSSVDVAESWHLAVLIPARNEEKLLARCLRSVLRAHRQLPAHVTFDLILVSDGSGDGTSRIARELISSSHGAVMDVNAGCVGRARACAANLALRRFAGDSSRCWLANTDADCEVPPHWLLDHLSFARQGAAAVRGIVDVDTFEEHGREVAARFRETYALHANGTHPHVHGANLGVRADRYLEAGGWADLQTAEDHDLWRRLSDGRGSCLSATSLCVFTSGRRVGRAPLGFAGALAAHNEAVLV